MPGRDRTGCRRRFIEYEPKADLRHPIPGAGLTR